MASERQRYLDHCEKCVGKRVIVPPVHIRPHDSGSGEVADYLCPAGHTWYTSWDYGDSNCRAA
ncbi:hypothetical protein Ade02nite_19420 [Paractinoplanes deccanensis]|uniref:Uncharacterized protein n=1 Tax=Paractinoplanes deccanensis TaxID=113561 RepID=A0ABQ3XZX5_9ACTN|nr:hypothetical protein Ade02nite_19420 [Actinoplanes deccanensis]